MSVEDASYPPVEQRYLELANKSAVYQDMLLLTKYFYITDIDTGDSLVLNLHDLGIRNFGGKFGKTILTFDGAGNLVDENGSHLKFSAVPDSGLILPIYC